MMPSKNGELYSAQLTLTQPDNKHQIASELSSVMMELEMLVMDLILLKALKKNVRFSLDRTRLLKIQLYSIFSLFI